MTTRTLQQSAGAPITLTFGPANGPGVADRSDAAVIDPGVGRPAPGWGRVEPVAYDDDDDDEFDDDDESVYGDDEEFAGDEEADDDEDFLDDDEEEGEDGEGTDDDDSDDDDI